MKSLWIKKKKKRLSLVDFEVFCERFSSPVFLSRLFAFSLPKFLPFFLIPSSSPSIHCVSMQVVSQRFPQNSIGAVGSAMFLRFINPAIVSPYEAGILDKKPPPRIERGLKLMSKVKPVILASYELQCGHLSSEWLLVTVVSVFSQILQSIANHVLFTKEEHMRPFNDFVKNNFEAARRCVWGGYIGV